MGAVQQDGDDRFAGNDWDQGNRTREAGGHSVPFPLDPFDIGNPSTFAGTSFAAVRTKPPLSMRSKSAADTSESARATFPIP